ncbi:exopolysaccharide biosynthesis glycosyltransferase VpsL [Halomonas shantousis]
MKSLNPIRGVAPIIDIVAIILAGFLAYGARFENYMLADRYIVVLFGMALLVVLINLFSGGYNRWRSTHLMRRIYRLVWVWGAMFALVASFMFLFQQAETFSRQWVVFTLALSFCFACAARAFLMMLVAYHNMHARHRKQVFLVGPGDVLLDVARSMRANQQEGYAIAGICRSAGSLDVDQLACLARRIKKSQAREVWLCMPVRMGDSVKPIMHALRHLTVEIRFIPQFSEIPLLNHRVSRVSGMHAIDLSVSPMTGGAIFVKRLEDIVVASLILLAISPVCLFVSLAIKLTSPGPIIFKQYRTGINGEDFLVYKFRSMKIHDEADGWVRQATQGDPRVTRVGAFIRRTSLDELPQFLNVLQGSMSIVGPRPHALAHNDYYKDLVESYMQRHKVKPGITGWAQVCGYRGETDTLDKMQKRVECDLWYINNWSLLLDMKIIFLTVFKGFSGKHVY